MLTPNCNPSVKSCADEMGFVQVRSHHMVLDQRWDGAGAGADMVVEAYVLAANMTKQLVLDQSIPLVPQQTWMYWASS